jgi:hypothetical protein
MTPKTSSGESLAKGIKYSAEWSLHTGHIETWRHIDEDMDIGTWSWGHGHGNMDMGTWEHGHGDMGTWTWGHGHVGRSLFNSVGPPAPVVHWRSGAEFLTSSFLKISLAQYFNIRPFFCTSGFPCCSSI